MGKTSAAGKKAAKGKSKGKAESTGKAAADNTSAKAVGRKAASQTTGDVEKPAGKKVSRRPASKARGKRFQPLSGEAVETMFARFAAIEPAPKGELEHVNVFTLLVAVVLSAQATDAGVNKATRSLFQKADTPHKMLALGEDAVRDHIKTIGLFRNKAKNVILLSQKLVDEHGGVVPADRDILETLPGVGRKTANVVLNMAFGLPTMAVDTHVLRVAERIGLTNATTPLGVEEDLLRLVPEAYGMHAHHWLILHGRYLCKARKPECWRCPISDVCRFTDKSRDPTSAV